jgi:hypothetical protein
VTRLLQNPRKICLILTALAVLPSPAAFWLADHPPVYAKPLHVAKAYFRASYARNFDAAYGHISSLDRQVGNQADYVQAQKSVGGFARRLAKIFADQIEFRVAAHEISAHRARLTLDYKVPAADELSSLLYNWDQDKLNALSRAEQQRIIGALEKMKKAGNMINIEGRETFNLIKEDDRWKVFLDWASGIKVSFDAALPSDSLVEVEVLKRELFASVDEPFQTNLKFWNRGQHEVLARIDHLIEPREFAGRIAMIACGFLRPLTLYPGEVREVSSAYLLDSGFPKATQLSITYEVKLGPKPSAASRQSNTASKTRNQ